MEIVPLKLLCRLHKRLSAAFRRNGEGDVFTGVCLFTSGKGGGTPIQPILGGGTTRPGLDGGTPSPGRNSRGVLDSRRAVWLLRSRRRTFLFLQLLSLLLVHGRNLFNLSFLSTFLPFITEPSLRHLKILMCHVLYYHKTKQSQSPSCLSSRMQNVFYYQL